MALKFKVKTQAEIPAELQSLYVEREGAFYLDAEGHPRDRSMELALEELHFFAREVRVLGVYHAHPYRQESQKFADLDA